MSEPMVRVLHSKCPECGAIANTARTYRTGEVIWRYGDVVSAELVRQQSSVPAVCKSGCGAMTSYRLIATEPVPGMGTPYPATERDEDSEYEYAREDAPLLQEDRR